MDASPELNGFGAPSGVGASPGVGDHAAGRLDEVARRLDAIEMALERVADGSYGTCEICGSGLGEELLSSHPTARRCPRCAPAASG